MMFNQIKSVLYSYVLFSFLPREFPLHFGAQSESPLELSKQLLFLPLAE